MRRQTRDRLTQHDRTIRDLAQMDQRRFAPKEIRDEREQTEMKLHRELARAGNILNVEKVMAFAFECEAAMAPKFLSAMLTGFDRDADALSLELLYLIEDAWDYLPHRFLKGHCPAEVTTGLFRDNLSHS
jgi:hypothetical protein